MTADQLSDASKSRLRDLLDGIRSALNDAASPHLRAVSDSFIEDPSTGSLTGGSLRAPGKPPFKYDDVALLRLHQALLTSDDGLFGVVVHGHRADPAAEWRVESKLVSRPEYKSIVRARRAVDAEVERHLRAAAEHVTWAWLSFGRDRFGKTPEVIRRTSTQLEKLPPSQPLMDQLDRTEQIYRDAGLDLRIALWTLRPGGLDFREVFE